MEREAVVSARLEDQISWYDRNSAKCQNRYRALKVGSLVLTGLVPLTAGFGPSPIVTGGIGFLALLLEGLQQLGQYHDNWISYRSTGEALKHEKYLFAAQAGQYRTAQDRLGLLAEQVEALVSTEHAKWIAGSRSPEQKNARSS